jgi:hypothetical protein
MILPSMILSFPSGPFVCCGEELRISRSPLSALIGTLIAALIPDCGTLINQAG